MIGRSQPMKRCSPPRAAISSSPGREMQVEGVAEHHLVAQVGDLGRGEPANASLGRQRDEGRGANLAVGELDQACAGFAVARLDLEAEPGRICLRRSSLEDSQRAARHRLRLRDAEQVERGRGDVGEDAAVAELEPRRR